MCYKVPMLIILRVADEQAILYYVGWDKCRNHQRTEELIQTAIPAQRSRGSKLSDRDASSQERHQASCSAPAGVRSKGRAQQPPQTGFRASFDRALPPFSAQRYVVIWLGFIILAALVFLLLAQPWKGAQVATSADKYMVIETPKGTIVAKLYTDASAGVSKTVANFQTKADAGFFNGLTFHRVEDWVIQGGDPAGNGTRRRHDALRVQQDYVQGGRPGRGQRRRSQPSTTTASSSSPRKTPPSSMETTPTGVKSCRGWT